jgi:hypothetical protein
MSRIDEVCEFLIPFPLHRCASCDAACLNASSVFRKFLVHMDNHRVSSYTKRNCIPYKVDKKSEKKPKMFFYSFRIVSQFKFTVKRKLFVIWQQICYNIIKNFTTVVRF